MAKLFRVGMTLPADVLHAVTVAAAGKAYDVSIVPVIDEPTNGSDQPDKSGPRVPAHAFLMPWWATIKQFSMIEAVERGATQGYSKGAIYTATAVAMKQGLLERTEPGQYKVLPKLKQTIKDAAKVAAKGAKASKVNGAAHGNSLGHAEFVLDTLKKGALTRADLKTKFVGDNRPERSIDGAMHRLKQKKLIKKTGDRWEVTAKAN